MRVRLTDDVHVGAFRLRRGSVVGDDNETLRPYLDGWLAEGLAVELKDAGAAPENKMLNVRDNKSYR